MTYEYYMKNIYREVPQLKDRKLTDEQIELILEAQGMEMLLQLQSWKN